MTGAAVLAAVALLAVVEVAVSVVLRPQTGPAALGAVLEPYLLATGAAAGALATARTLTARGTGAALVKLVGIAAIVLAVTRLGSEWWSSPDGPDPRYVPADATRITVLTWNLETGAQDPGRVLRAIAGEPDDQPAIVFLQELTPEVAAAIEGTEGIDGLYPYRILAPRPGVEGMGILATMPLVRGLDQLDPMLLSAEVPLGDGRRLALFDVHPYPPAITRTAGIPTGLDTRRRDEDLSVIAATVDRAPDASLVILAGDLNTTPFEPGFERVRGGRVDAHGEAATGTGFTWRPSSLEWLHAGLLRLDHVLVGDAIEPVAVAEDCSLPGDHCRLLVTLDIPRTP